MEVTNLKSYLELPDRKGRIVLLFKISSSNKKPETSNIVSK